jgi:hypothetical protein
MVSQNAKHKVCVVLSLQLCSLVNIEAHQLRMQSVGVRRDRVRKEALNRKFRRHRTFSQDHASQQHIRQNAR